MPLYLYNERELTNQEVIRLFWRTNEEAKKWRNTLTLKNEEIER